MNGHVEFLCPAGECDGYGGVEVGGCTCGQGPHGYYGMLCCCCGAELDWWPDVDPAPLGEGVLICGRCVENEHLIRPGEEEAREAILRAIATGAEQVRRRAIRSQSGQDLQNLFRCSTVPVRDPLTCVYAGHALWLPPHSCKAGALPAEL